MDKKQYSTAQEKRIARGRGRTTFNSGATPFDKGDVEWADALIECKTKTKPSESITIKKEWLDKIKEEAINKHKAYYFMFFGFGDGGEEYFIVPQRAFEQLYDDSHLLEKIVEEVLGGDTAQNLMDDPTREALKRIIREG